MSTAVENYNQLAQQQRSLTTAIAEGLNGIVQALANKETLAAQQKQLQAEIGIQYPEHSPADVRRQIVDSIVRRLENRDATGLTDWSTRLATPGGNLEE